MKRGICGTLLLRNKASRCSLLAFNSTSVFPDLQQRPPQPRSEGHSKTEIWQKKTYRIFKKSSEQKKGHIRNTEDSVQAVWNFLKLYVLKGFHVNIATDNNKIHDKAKELSGDRIQYRDSPVVHVASLMKNQDAREGLKSALLEKLLLMTSSEALLVSRSGFSLTASYAGMKLMG